MCCLFCIFKNRILQRLGNSVSSFTLVKIMQTATTFLCPETKEVENTVEEIITVSR